MKNKTIIILMLIISASLFCIFAIFSIIKDKPSKSGDDAPTNPIEKHPNNKPNLTDAEAGEKIMKITEYGIKMYEDGSYLSFKERDEYYYITLGELKAKGYTEIESLLYDCDDNDAIIYFYKDKEEFEKYPITVKYYCSNN